MISHRLSRLAIVILALAITTIIGFYGNSVPLVRAIEAGLRDNFQRLLVRDEPAAEIVLVDIDEASIRSIGPWPWPRKTIADLVEAIRNQYPDAVVVLDIVLPDPRDAQGDTRLKALLDQRAIVLAQVFDYAIRQEPVISGEPQGALPFAPVESRMATGVIANHALLKAADPSNPCIGNIGFIPDPDGRLRRLPAYTEWQMQHFPSLGLASLLCTGRLRTDELSAFPAGDQVIRYSLSPAAWPTISAEVFLEPKTVGAQTIQALTPAPRFFIVGSSALGLSDRVATPLSPNISGMYVHAQAIHNLIEQQHATKSQINKDLGLFVLGLFGVGFLGLLVLLKQNTFHVIAAGGVMFIGWTALAARWIEYAPNTAISGPLWGLALLCLATIVLGWRAQRERLFKTRTTLERYVAPEVLRTMGQELSKSSLTPVERQLTVLVVDMADYTQTIRDQALTQSSELTKLYLDRLTRAVLQEHGTLDRYTGDGLIAFWGAPFAQIDSDDRAVAAAVSMVEAMKTLNQGAANPNAISIRIGIASGIAVVGDFGTPERANYTAVGTCINLAARLEQLAKEERKTILITEEVVTKLSRFTASAVGQFEIRGIGEIRVYTPAVK